MIVAFSRRIIFCIVSIIFFIHGCNNISYDEIQRMQSTDLKVDAVITRTNAGATTSFAYMLYLVPSGNEVIQGQEIFRADKLVDMKIIWTQPKILEIHYQKGRIFHFTNFWSSEKIDNFKHVIEIRLVPSI